MSSRICKYAVTDVYFHVSYQLPEQEEYQQEQGNGYTRQQALPYLIRRMKCQNMSLPSSPPMFLIADATGIAAVIVPEALADAWLPLLMATEMGSMTYTFSELSFEKASGGKELYDSMQIHFQTPAGYELPISPAILVVTPSSSFQIMGSPRDLHSTHMPLGSGSISQFLEAREGLLDALSKGAGRGESSNGTSPRRVTVLVTVRHIATAPSASWSEDPYALQLLLCVRDESLARANAHNALLLICDRFQMLSCAALLEVGDCLLVRGAVVCPPSHCR